MVYSAASNRTVTDSAQKAQTGILIAGIVLLVMLMFGTNRQRVSQQFVNTTAGSTVETALIDTANARNLSVEVVTQLQYTQQALFKTEVVTGEGQLISEINQDFNSNNSEITKAVKMPDWPNTDAIKVRLTVASQAITATPPQGITADQVPVIFEVNVYRQRFSRAFLWPGLFACIALWIIVKMARANAST